MSETRKALDGFFSAINEQSSSLTQAGQEFRANPEDPAAHKRFTKLSLPEGYPDVHRAAVAFQEALHATSKAGHLRGWTGGEQELETLQIAAQTHGVDPGLFVTAEGAGSKREHILQLARLYNGKFLPGDGRNEIWDPQAHSFPTAEDANSFADMVNHYYPDVSAKVEEGQYQGKVVGDDGQPIPSPEPTWSVKFTHEQLGEPYPPGTGAHAAQIAQQRSSQMPHPHHVIVDPTTGEHQVTLEPEPNAQVVQTFQGGQPLQSSSPPEGEQPPEKASAAETAPAEPRDSEQPAPAAQGAAPAGESVDAIDRLLSESFGINKKPESSGPRSINDLTSDQHRALLDKYKECGTWNHPGIKAILGIDPDAALPRFLKKRTHQQFARAAGLRPRMDEEQEMGGELEEMKALFRASLKKTPTLMMENVPVDSNRGVTARGNSHFDRYASPNTREKVLEARLQDIEAFAQSRKLPVSNIYAAVEASMRTGKVPDLGQYGLAGDDAVATKQFIVSNILNIQGLEATDYKGDPIEELDGPVDEPDGRSPVTTRQSRTPRNPGSETGEPRVSQTLARGPAQQKRYRQRLGREMSEGKEEDRAKRFMKTHAQGGRTERSYRSPKPKKYTIEDKIVEGEERQRELRSKLAQHVAQMMGRHPEHHEVQEVVRKHFNRFFNMPGVPSPSGEVYTKGQGRSSLSADVNIAPEDVERAIIETHGAYGKAMMGTGPYVNQPLDTKKKLKKNRYPMAEEGGPYRTGGAPSRAPLSPQKILPGANAPIDKSKLEKWPLLPKEALSKLRSEIGNRVDGLPQWELYDIARERGILGTEESVSDQEIIEHDFEGCAKKFGGKFITYVQPHQGIYEFPSKEKAAKFAAMYSSYTTSTPKIDGKRVSIDEPMLGESARFAPRAPGTEPTVHTSGPSTRPPASGEKKKKEDNRSDSDKILGIEEGDPRAESWPKISSEMKRLMNLEDCRVFGRTCSLSDDKSETVEEATIGCGNVGAFIGGGMMPGGGMVARDDMIAPYDASLDLRDDKEKEVRAKADVDSKRRKERLAKLLREIGITKEKD